MSPIPNNSQLRILPVLRIAAHLAAIFLVLVPVSFGARADGSAPRALVALEAGRNIFTLGVPVHAHLVGRNGQENVLTLVPSNEASKPGRTMVDSDSSGKSYLIALERRTGARLEAAKSLPVLWDDGKHLILSDAPGRGDALAAMGFDLEVLPEDPILELRRTEPLLTQTPPFDARVQAIVDSVTSTQLDAILAGLAGDVSVTISGSPYTITTRNTRSGTPIQKATQYMYERLGTLGLVVNFHDWTYSSTSGRNVVAQKLGTSRPGEVVLVTAHLDDMPSTGAAPGADDNGSGSAAVLRIAEVLNAYTFERTIRFVLFTGEEQGLYGSRRYAESVSALGENIVGVLNMDMIAWDATGGPTLRIHTRSSASPGYTADKEIFDVFAAVVTQYGLASALSPILSADGETASDHSSFWNKGYPAVLAIEDDYDDFNAYYHTSNDKRSNTNLTYFTNFTKAAAGTAALLGLIQPVPCAQPVVPTAFEVDWAATSLTTGNLNRIMEPGERILFNPYWMLPESCAPRLVAGQIASFTGPSGPAYTISRGTANYGYMTPGVSESPLGKSGDAYVLSVSPNPRPVTHWDVNVQETLTTGDTKTWKLHVGGSFLDVLLDNWAYPYVERLLHNGISVGISGIEYLPLGTVDRWQMAIFLARALAGGEAGIPASGTAKGTPYSCVAGGASIFTDVTPTDIFCKHVHYIYDRSVTVGCDPGGTAYCPMTPVSRWQMAIFIARAVAGSDALIPLEDAAYSCSSSQPRLHFGDVQAADPYCRHIHYLWNRGTVSGCSNDPVLFCPSPSTNRAEMAKFLSLGFDLGL